MEFYNRNISSLLYCTKIKKKKLKRIIYNLVIFKNFVDIFSVRLGFIDGDVLT